MKLILDFDHTLFDTDRFCLDAAAYKESGMWVTPAIWDILSAQDYLFPDVQDFLRTCTREDVSILTAITPSLGPESDAFQRMKVERSGVKEFVSQVEYMIGEKGSWVKNVCDRYPNEVIVFIDDRTTQLESVRSHCPQARILQMCHEALTSITSDEGGNFPLVHNFTEVSAILESWNRL